MAIRLLQRMLVNDLIYWAPKANDGYGNKVYLPPVDVRGRWIDTNDLFTNILGKEIRSNAKVYYDNTVTAFLLGGMIMKGSIAELGNVTDPLEVRLDDGRKPFEILKVESRPTFKGDEDSRTVWV